LCAAIPAYAVAQAPHKAPAKPPANTVESHGVVPASSVAKPPVTAGGAGHGGTEHKSPTGDAGSSCTSLSALTKGLPVVPETAGPGFASFVDPSARIESPERVMIGCRSFVGPFVSLDGSSGPIAIGDETDVQDNVLISGTLVMLGDHVIVAHGATIVGPATVGASKGKPAFVGFNAYIDGAMVEPDAFVGHLARLAPGIVIRSGTKVLPGKFIKTQEEADQPALGKVTSVTDADRAFMAGVLHVNTEFASGYTDLFHMSPSQVSGVGRDPGHSDFNHDADLPSFAGKAEARADFPRMRIIGAVRMDDALDSLNAKVGRNISIRADEGEHFHIGILTSVQDRVTFHALEHTDIDVGQHDTFGFHVVVHGGPDDGAEPHELTRIEDDVTVKDWAVVFRSKIGKGSTIGVRAFVDGSHLAPGTVVPDRAIMIRDKIVGYVEW
jgi:carbonic anhydrase/acetyltransferase-like protein (isoleucine patch superfamily)